MITQFGECQIELVLDDIVCQIVDAIVNAANTRLAGGGGVDGAIHRAAGPELMQETQQKFPQGCPTGKAVITSAGKLNARYVIHTVGPIWRGGFQNEPTLLKSAYCSSLELAIKANCQSVAFPAISTGVFGYPSDLAAEVSLEAVRDFLIQYQRPQLIKFVLFDQGMFGAYARVLESL